MTAETPSQVQVRAALPAGGLDLAPIIARAEAATAGPWFWRGNVDNGAPRLVARGRDVLGHYPRERSTDDREYADRFRYYRDEGDVEGGIDAVTKQMTYRSPTREEAHAHVRETWLEDAWGEPIRDDVLAFVNEHLMYVDARELVVFEVCREAVDRSDPRVYRGDIVGVRHPDAEFIANARADVDALLAEVQRLRALVAQGADSLPTADKEVPDA